MSHCCQHYLGRAAAAGAYGCSSGSRIDGGEKILFSRRFSRASVKFSSCAGRPGVNLDALRFCDCKCRQQRWEDRAHLYGNPINLVLPGAQQVLERSLLLGIGWQPAVLPLPGLRSLYQQRCCRALRDIPECRSSQSTLCPGP